MYLTHYCFDLGNGLWDSTGQYIVTIRSDHDVVFNSHPAHLSETGEDGKVKVLGDIRVSNG
jgi:hypothetical protein